jgi:hypothetical protein
MAFTSLKGEINTEFKEVGEKVDGIYIETKINQGRDQNSSVHTIKKDNGELASFWGSMALDDMLNKCNPGDYIRVEYQGKAKSKMGKEYHSWEVFVDRDKSVVVDTPQPAVSNAGAIPVEDDDDMPF